jgi:hypothetical protein
VQRVSTNFLPQDLGLREHREGQLVVSVSAPERAALEFLQHLTLDAAGYEHANLVFEGLGTLRPDVVCSLLEACASVKVKRLFLHLAEKQAHPCSVALWYPACNIFAWAIANASAWGE